MVAVPPEYLSELTPPDAFAEGNRDASYWIRDGREVLYRHYPLRGGDPKTFRFFRAGFGKDARACYCTSKRLKDADPESFQALNLTYAADSKHVWTFGGQIKDAHRPSFEVCDSGAVAASRFLIPTGYARDRGRVFYYNYDGKPNVVRKATSASFVSLDGVFGADAERVFFEIWELPKASPATWRRLEGRYSIDGPRVYCCHWRIPEADARTFRVVDVDGIQVAVDDKNFFINGKVAPQQEYESVLAQKAELQRKYPRPD